MVADGSNSRLGRMLGTSRRRDLPLGMALRGYYRSERHDDPFIESHLDIRDAEGNVVPGYGWIFPMGDGRVNVGVGLLSTDAALEGREHDAPHGRLRRLRTRRPGVSAPRRASGRPRAASCRWGSRSGRVRAATC